MANIVSINANQFVNLSLSLLMAVALSIRPATAGESFEKLQSFLTANCADCHQGDEPEAGFDVTQLGSGLNDPHVFEKWVQVFDRIELGEMPPPDHAKLELHARQEFLQPAGKWLSQYELDAHAAVGRVRGRRLTNLQMERTLHALLGIDIPLANQLPEERRTAGFSTVADGQAMSHFQLARHLAVVDLALDEAFRRALEPADAWERHFDAPEICRKNPRTRCREPELIDGRAVTWSSRLEFYGRLPATTVRESGWYRVHVRAKAIKSPVDIGVWCTVRSGRGVSSAPLLPWIGAFEATSEPKDWTFEAWIAEGDMLEIRPGDAKLKVAKFQGGQVGTGEGDPQDVPGVAIESLSMERIHRGPNDEQIRQLLFGNLEAQRTGDGQEGKLASSDPHKDAAELVRRFAARAFRRPASNEETELFQKLVAQALDEGNSLIAALRGGYRAILCSPRFLYFVEQPGKLDDYAIASRLSYFLWNSMPDDELMQLASESKLSDPQVLSRQVERLLTDPRGRWFVKDLAAEWLDLSLIDFTEPDRKLYPDFDQIVQNSMVAETHAYLQTMLDENLSISQLIDSDFTFLNSRLARFYSIEGVTDDTLQRIKLEPKDHRGGVLTQGAVLKITANGTTTSPVIRGVWIAERLLGQPIPPPPEGVPAIEPDIRGAKTIREMLAKHRSDDNCAVCHIKIDPPGFALENYDPAGQWRDKYAQIVEGRVSRAAKVDASYSLADGREFKNIEQFRQLLIEDRQSLARNAVEKLLTYGTGADVGFSDRESIAEIVKATASSNYGFRSLLHAVVTSRVFLTK